MKTPPRSHTATSSMSFRMPREIRRRIRIAAGIDDQLVPDWCIAVLDKVARARIDRSGLDLLGTSLGIGTDEARRRLTCDQVIDAVAAYYGWTRSELGSRSRRRGLLKPRQVAMVLCRRYTDATDIEITGHFNRQHTALPNAEKRIAARIEAGFDVTEFRSLTETLDLIKGKGSTVEDEAIPDGGPDRDPAEGEGPA